MKKPSFAEDGQEVSAEDLSEHGNIFEDLDPRDLPRWVRGKLSKVREAGDAA